MSAGTGVAAALHQARRSGQALAAFPAPIPATLADAYTVQRDLCAALGVPLLGWKVGRIPQTLIETLGAERLAGPVLRVAELDGEAPGDARVFAGGVGVIEAEIILRLSAVPTRRLASDREAMSFIDEIRAGFEVASSPAPDVHDHAPYGIIADIGINNGLLLGPRLDAESFDRIVITEIEGSRVGSGRPCDILDGPLGSLRFLVDLHMDGVIALEAGQWISAGAITGVHPIAPGQTATAHFGETVRIACTASTDPGFAS
ncbi:2-keto-4-pentenoate hydratase [Sphingopyxis flava]|uniref:2-keto-4-pentenoate hydratase n=1 Tax=Sphingopyxis flava TaxID=1507287 RepID=A0A1T5AUW3_9SPHN|nr:hypothetical protein [Sphingopyxis flava]SKB38808.1 2-keto-4-pentenoate hydratase [Sphingopyxis flava]